MKRSLLLGRSLAAGATLGVLLLAGPTPTPPRAVAFDPEAHLSMSRAGDSLLLNYTTSATEGTVTIRQSERSDGLAAGTVVFSGPVPPNGVGSLVLPNWASPTPAFFNLTWDAQVPNPATESLAWIPPGTVTLGSPSSEMDRQSDEGPQITATLPTGFFLGRHEVTQAEYMTIATTNPSAFTGDLSRPVDSVTWAEATNYCGLLTARERAAGRISPGYEYRLPTEAEWEYAARCGTSTRFSHGDDPDYSVLGDYAWFATNATQTTHPVAQKQPNAWGLYDMSGNVAEWCGDPYSPYSGGARVEPTGPPSGLARVNRGGGFDGGASFCRSAFRGFDWQDRRYSSVGFRVALAPIWTVPASSQIAMIFVPPGTFSMGSPTNEPGRGLDESPATEVTIAQGFLMSIREITQAEYAATMGTNRSYFTACPDAPAEQVSWDDAMAFCTTLTRAELAAGRLPAGYAYRLPTEAEWEYAARAGTTNSYSFGDDPTFQQLGQYGWFLRNANFVTYAGGARQPNAWGLYDLHGNVAEWCLDFYGTYPGGSVIDPTGAATGTTRVARGGSFFDDGYACRSAARLGLVPSRRANTLGFRVVLGRVKTNL